MAINIEHFTESQIQSIVAMDQTLSRIEQVKAVPMPTDNSEYLESMNQQAFNYYWDATRHLGPNGEIIKDQDMITIGAARLLERGVPQWIKHEVLVKLDKI